MKIDLHAILERAYFAGFIDSHDGYNGEDPFNGDMRQITRELGQSAELAIGNILRDVDATAEARPPAPVVTDEMVDAAIQGYGDVLPTNGDFADAMRAALEAALGVKG